MKVIYKRLDGVIKDFTDGEVKGLNPLLALAVINGSYTGKEINISELDITYIPIEIASHEVVKRLKAAGKLADALAILEMDQENKALFFTATVIDDNDADVIAVIEAVGLVASNILY